MGRTLGNGWFLKKMMGEENGNQPLKVVDGELGDLGELASNAPQTFDSARSALCGARWDLLVPWL